MFHTIPLNTEVISCSIPGHDHISHYQHKDTIFIIQTYTHCDTHSTISQFLVPWQDLGWLLDLRDIFQRNHLAYQARDRMAAILQTYASLFIRKTVCLHQFKFRRNMSPGIWLWKSQHCFRPWVSVEQVKNRCPNEHMMVLFIMYATSDLSVLNSQGLTLVKVMLWWLVYGHIPKTKVTRVTLILQEYEIWHLEAIPS